MNFGGLGLNRKAKTFFGKSYDPINYWEKRGKHYHLEKHPEPTELINHLKSISFDSVLEFGCGSGRITKAILDNFDPSKYTAFDISSDQISQTRMKCSTHSINCQISSIQNFNSTTKYDLVIGSEVLQHILHNDIHDSIRHLLSFSEDHFIHEDLFYDPNYEINKTSHTFRHNYEKIYFEIGNFQIKKIKSSNEKLIFDVTRKNS